MGYPVARFHGEIDEEFICSICHEVIKDPLQTSCEHIFCSECINPWLNTDPSCPIDRAVLTPDQLKPASRIFRSFMARLQLTCDNAEYGCTSIVHIEALPSHLTHCEYQPNKEVTCQAGCKIKLLRKDLPAHNCLDALLEKVSEMTSVVKRKDETIASLETVNKLLTEDYNSDVSALIPEGIFKSYYSSENPEQIITLSYVDGSEVRGTKITSSSSVPAGELAFTADLNHCVHLNATQQNSLDDILRFSAIPSDMTRRSTVQEFILPDGFTSTETFPSTCIGRFYGRMRHAEIHFTNPSFVPGHWIIFDPNLMGFLLLKEDREELCLYHRVKETDPYPVPIRPGLFMSYYGTSNPEQIIKLSYVGGIEARATKINGSSAVPAGKLSFNADLSHHVVLNASQQTSMDDILRLSANRCARGQSPVQDFILPVGYTSTDAGFPSTSIDRFYGNLQRAEPNFANPYWFPGHWIIFDENLMGFLILHEDDQELLIYHRIEETETE